MGNSEELIYQMSLVRLPITLTLGAGHVPWFWEGAWKQGPGQEGAGAEVLPQGAQEGAAT